MVVLSSRHTDKERQEIMSHVITVLLMST